MPVSASWYSNTAPRTEENEIWYVALAPDEVKRMTLEQLDDAFRLDVIDAGTHVWQPGMSSWHTLGNMAGIDDAPETTPAPARAVHAVAAAPRRTAGPPHAVERDPNVLIPVAGNRGAVGSAPATVRIQPAPAAPPPGALARPAHGNGAPARLDRTAQANPPAAARPKPAPAPAPTRVEPAAYPVARPAVAQPVAVPKTVAMAAVAPMPQVRPLRMEANLYAPPQRNRLGNGLLSVAALSGLVISLYRNDVFRDQARSLGLTTTYYAIEAQVGSPGFGTPRSIEILTATADTPTKPKPNLRAAVAPESDSAPNPSQASEPEKSSAAPVESGADTGRVAEQPPAAGAARSSPAAKPEPPEPAPKGQAAARVAAEPKGATPTPASPPPPSPAPEGRSDSSPEAKMAALLGGGATPDTARAAPRPAAAPRRPAAARDTEPQKPKKSSGKAGNEYDPLNPDL